MKPIKRRKFIASSLTATSLLAGATVQAGAAMRAVTQVEKAKPEYYELRQYHMLTGPRQKPIHDYLREAAIPAMNRNGIGPIGVFNVVYGPTNPTLYVLIPHKTLETFANTSQRLAADAEYQRSGAPFLNAPFADPAYVRVEVSLMVAFEGMPKLEVPPGAAGNKPRIFELRIYESHNEQAGKKKVEMFNAGGEIAIFRKTGLRPVFFGESLTGPRLPNLVYMLSFEDMQARDKSWETFRTDPEWKKLSANSVYKDTVSNITDIILRPTAYSQI